MHFRQYLKTNGMKKTLTKLCILLQFSIAIPILVACSGTKETVRQAIFFATSSDGRDGSVYRLSSNTRQTPDPPQLMAAKVICPRFSPDLTHLAFSSHGNIAVQEVGSDTERTFDINFWSLTQPVWAPDGSKLAFAGSPKAAIDFNIWVLDLSNGALTQISQCTGNAAECDVSQPDWSNDNRLAYGIRSESQQGVVIYRVDTGQNDLIPYPLVFMSFPYGANNVKPDPVSEVGASIAWSPDSVHLALATMDSSVHILNTQSLESVQVVSSNSQISFDSPIWSLDGKWLLLRQLKWEQFDFRQVTEYGFAVADVTSGLSTKNFKLEMVFHSTTPFTCPDRLEAR
jgi:Tol biopolymer transport system component